MLCRPLWGVMLWFTEAHSHSALVMQNFRSISALAAVFRCPADVFFELYSYLFATRRLGGACVMSQWKIDKWPLQPFSEIGSCPLPREESSRDYQKPWTRCGFSLMSKNSKADAIVARAYNC
eukprot:4518000-Amphidinium_carterae.1